MLHSLRVFAPSRECHEATAPAASRKLFAAFLVCVLMVSGASAEPVRYRTELTPVDDLPLQTALEASSNLLTLEDAKDPPPAAGLVRRAVQDRDRMWTALRSFGFYAGDVRVTISDLPLDTHHLIERIEVIAAEGPVTVAIVVEPGPLYRIGSFEVLNAVIGQMVPRTDIDRAALGVAVGDPARAGAVIGAQSAVVDKMRGQGYPFAAVPNRRVVVDHATRKMEVTLTAEPGPFALFGESSIEGLEEMDEDFVRGRFDATPGRRFSPKAVRSTRDNLADLDVFSGIRVEPADELDADGRLPVTAIVTERPRRVIGIGADFATSEGFAGRVYWGHRNLFGRAERLRLQAEVGRVGENEPEDIEYGIDVQYEVPDFLTRDQTFRAEILAGREAPDAYRREAIEALVGVDRQVSEALQVSAGLSAELSEVNDLSASEPLFFVGVPLGLRLDTTDNLLDPTRGFRVALKAKSYFVDRTFLRAGLSASTYFDLLDDGGLVLAVRTRLGSLVGEDLFDVPSDKRFFSGGGGSVRGYAFQAIGPRTGEDDPLGGLSVLELGFEARVRITDEIGVVPFIEGGQVFEDSFPHFDEDLQFGAGLGLRYFTQLGPLRLDVAVPINKRSGDDDFQIYVSIGQAF